LAAGHRSYAPFNREKKRELGERIEKKGRG
jgi:hypothetical protein